MATKPNHSHNQHTRGHRVELSAGYRFNRSSVMLVAGFVVAAGFVLLLAHAAGVFVTAEAETGTKSGPVATVADTTASGGSAVQFNAPVVTPPPPPTPPTGPVTSPGPSSCTMNAAGRACWASHTGIPNGTGGRWTEAQITAGQAGLTKVTGNVALINGGMYYWNPDTGVRGALIKSGTTFDSYWIEGCVAVKDNNMTLKNSYVRTQAWCRGGNGQAGPTAINTGNCQSDKPTGTITNFQLIDSEVSTGNFPPGGNSYATIGACNYTVLRSSLHGGPVIVWATNNANLTDTYVHDPSLTSGTDHIDGVDCDSGTHVTLNHNYISIAGNQSSATGSLSINNSWSPADHFTVTNNFLEGASGADVNFGGGTTPQRPWGNAIYQTFTGNALSPNNGWGSTQFSYGWVSTNVGMVWSNNFNSETLKQLAPNGT